MDKDNEFTDIDELWFDDFWFNEEPEKEITSKITKWNVDSFLQSNSIDLSNIDPSSLARYINRQNTEQKKQIIDDIRIKNYFKQAILSGEKSYRFYENIFKYIDFTEMKDIFDKEFVDKFFSKQSGKEYILFASIFNNTKNPNESINIIINNEELFNAFKEQFTNFYSAISTIDSEHYKKLIETIAQTNSYDYFNILIINQEKAEIIIKENYSTKTLVWLIEKMPIDIISNFFLNDPRAELIIPYLKNNKINRYLDRGIKFGSRVLKNPDFFEVLKCESLISFRERINNIEDYCEDPIILEEKRKKYYDTLINSYQQESGLFKVYEDILNNPHLYFEDEKEPKDPYIVNRSMYRIGNRNKEYLLKETNQKLSEIVVDALFQDDIYNTWINIKELLKYNSHLTENEKIVSKENLEFYKLILEIDECPPEEKIELYNKLKDKNINLMFYEDMRKTKDLAYQKIKEKMIIPTNHPEYENKEISEKYGITTYDLRDKEYYMLVRRLGGIYHEKKSGYASGSYSLISNNNTEVFNEDSGIIYGYNGFNNSKVEHMYEGDSFTASVKSSSNKTKNATTYPNRISTAEELADSFGYSEILLKNKETEKDQYHEMQPDFIVVIDEVNERSIEASKTLNIPLVIIKSNRNYKVESNFATITDKYTQGSLYEEDRKNQR